MKFIHVVRDGRDMAFSANQNQLRKHGAAVLGRELEDTPQPVRAAALWARVNEEAASYGELRMTGRYLLVTFERLCSHTRETVQQIFDFLESDPARLDAAVKEIAPPSSIGRWRHNTDEGLLSAIQAHAGDALRRFGFV